jgi:hypothetical protein
MPIVAYLDVAQMPLGFRLDNRLSANRATQSPTVNSPVFGYFSLSVLHYALLSTIHREFQQEHHLECCVYSAKLGSHKVLKVPGKIVKNRPCPLPMSGKM